MTYILDAPNGPAAMQRAACHELRRRLGRFFQRNVVIAFEEWRAAGGVAPFNYETFCGRLNEEHTDELLDLYQLLLDEECAGQPAEMIYPYIVDGASEGESYTTSVTFVQKLRVSFTAVLGVRYRIDYNLETFCQDEEDVKAQVQLNDSTDIGFHHFRNGPYADRWSQMNSGFYISDALSGNIDVDIDWRNAYGSGAKGIRRARVIVTRVDEAPP